MSSVCSGCGYQRKHSDIWPEHECPKCGKLYTRGKETQEKPSAIPEMKPGHNKKIQYDLLKEIRLLIRSRYGMILIRSKEEARMESLLKHLADSMNLPLFVWSSGKGLKRHDLENCIYGTSDPQQALGHMEHSLFPAIYCFEGLRPYIGDPALQAKLASISKSFTNIEGALIITDSDIEIPDGACLYAAEVQPLPPEREDFEDLLKNIIRDLQRRMYIKVDISDRDMNRLLMNLRGLTLLEAEKILTKAVIEDRCLGADDIQRIIDAKIAIVERDGLLEYFPFESSMDDIADLASIKLWLHKRTSIIARPDKAASYGLQFPKGILLLGVPGSGKSLCAKAVAMEWKLPLLKMDPSALYNKYLGESEKNFKRAMDTAEKMSPVVLWIDEIEKAFSSGSDMDSGVSQRVLGIFLSWMQERKGDVFVVATSNDVAKLPPEFLRKGRFDEIFFVDLPDGKTRNEIFRIHIQRRGHDCGSIDLQILADATDGFSGAEIEQVIVSALYTSFSDESPLTTELLIQEAQSTCPLSVTRAEHIQALREWAQGRTVSAQ